MADDRSEKPTSRRLEKAREEGSVAQSPEVPSAAVLFVMAFLGPWLASRFPEHWRQMWVDLWSVGPHVVESAASAGKVYREGLWVALSMLVPLLGSLLLIAVAIAWTQTGFLIAPLSLKLDFNRMNPVTGMGRIFSQRTLAEFIKLFIKLAAFTLVCGFAIHRVTKGLWVGGLIQPDQLWFLLVQDTGRLLKWVAFLVLAIAGADYWYQWRNYMSKMKMTKREIKEEHKETEGNPQIKSRIKSLMRRMANRIGIKKVPQADVVITNPTHLAVALAYKPNMRAPVVLAKGADSWAEKIRRIAIENGVPLVENKPLARVLYQFVEPGEEVSPKMYQAVAEVLAYVFQMRRRGETRS